MLSWIEETTNENKKSLFRNKKNPYRKSGCTNMLHRFFGYSVPRYIKFHYEAMEKDIKKPEFIQGYEEPVAMVNFSFEEKK